jgi:4-amino-4-deoxy-L-arabinose transferase-like glycosyltransferase
MARSGVARKQPAVPAAFRGEETLQSTPDIWSGGTAISLLLSGAVAVRLIPLAFGVESTDILLYRQQAIPVAQVKNVYAVTRNVFPYTPVSMFYPALCLGLSEMLRIPFDVVLKLFAIVADVGIVLALYALGVRLLPRRTAIWCAALYAVNPVSILVSSFHGNIMPLVVLLMLASYLLFRADPDRTLTVSGLLLGLAVGWRSFPILLLPFFLTSIETSAKKIRFVACVVAPAAVAMIPFAWVDARSMLREVLSYSGWGIHHGPFGILRGLHLFSIGRVTWENPPEWIPWMSSSKLAFLALYGIAVLLSKRMGLLNGILVTFFLFYLVYSGVASQYLIWAVPFLLLTERKAMFWCYELAATYALVVFYWLFFPDILFGALDVPHVGAAPLVRQYVMSQSLFSAVCAVGVVRFGTGVAAPVQTSPATGEVVPTLKPWGLGLLAQLVCLYYLLLFFWEIVFVRALK